MKNTSSGLYELLSLAFENRFTPASVKKVFSPFLTDRITLKSVKKNTYVMQMGEPVKKIMILLTGQCHIVKYDNTGNRIITDSMKPVQLFGLYEMLNHMPSYSASIVSAENAVFLVIPSSILMKQLESDIKSTLLVARYLSSLTEYSFRQRNSEKFLSEYENLLLYLYRKTFGKKAPVSLKLNRKTMSEELNINLRTLYRYLNKLKEENQISIIHSLIVLSDEQLRMLESRIEEFV